MNKRQVRRREPKWHPNMPIFSCTNWKLYSYTNLLQKNSLILTFIKTIFGWFGPTEKIPYSNSLIMPTVVAISQIDNNSARGELHGLQQLHFLEKGQLYQTENLYFKSNFKCKPNEQRHSQHTTPTGGKIN